MFKNIYSVFFLIIFCILSIHTETVCSFVIKKNTVFEKNKSPYIFNDDIIVEENTSLTIEPGVEIIFPFNLNKLPKIIIKGALIAKGDKNKLISFRSSQSKMGSWGGIFFESPGNNIQSVIEYCKIENARGAIVCFNASPVIQNNILTINEVAIVCEDHSSPSVISNTIISNGIAEIYPSAIHCTLWSAPVIQNNIFDKNLGHAVYCEAYSSPLISGNKISNMLGSNIVCASFSDPKIINNEISRGSAEFGIILYNSSPQISENIISNKRLYGITSIYSKPVISNNIFSQNYIGIFCICSPASITGNNISKSNIGIVLAENSQPLLKDNITSLNGIEIKTIRDQMNNTPAFQNSQIDIRFSGPSDDKPLILFHSFYAGSWNIGLLNGATLKWDLLTKNSFHNGSAAWSPDGNSIAFTSNRKDSWDIYIMDTSGQNIKNITNTPVFTEEAPPIWSPDGKKIAFLRETPECSAVILDLDTNKIDRIELKNTEKEYPGLYPLVFFWMP